MITILDYGMGNLRSVEKAFASLGVPCRVATSVGDAEKVVIPGVGAFGAAMERLEPLRDELEAFVASGRPLLGICLGQQLLFESSEEFGEHRGLGFLPGTVRYLPTQAGLKLPHMGWAPLRELSDHALLAGVREGDQMYFVHSLHTELADGSDRLAACDYGDRIFAAVVGRGNVMGAQFHPEKSGTVGLRILRNFATCW